MSSTVESLAHFVLFVGCAAIAMWFLYLFRGFVFGTPVDAVTKEIEPQYKRPVTMSASIIIVPKRQCPSGSRFVHGKCREVYPNTLSVNLITS
ncbi:unnamed protein product [Nezara viridula]|uniref:Uncharacterized protein n=1 Tax=Nezara viridula TaxID=85310 RepID=A0A9P0H0L2_NEZVI|nr:unnamed protein product [Nezara viridula]